MVQLEFAYDNISLREAKYDFASDLRDNHEAVCPCCGVTSRIYRRKIHKAMIDDLVSLYRKGGNERYIHNNVFLLGNKGLGDFGKFQYWGMVDHKFNEERGTKDSGMWKITKDGISFLKGNHYIPKYAYVKHDEVLYFSDEMYTVHDAYKEPFNFKEIF
jgi:hypothetical protein